MSGIRHNLRLAAALQSRLAAQHIHLRAHNATGVSWALEKLQWLNVCVCSCACVMECRCVSVSCNVNVWVCVRVCAYGGGGDGSLWPQRVHSNAVCFEFARHTQHTHRHAVLGHRVRHVVLHVNTGVSHPYTDMQGYMRHTHRYARQKSTNKTKKKISDRSKMYLEPDGVHVERWRQHQHMRVAGALQMRQARLCSTHILQQTHIRTYTHKWLDISAITRA